MVHERDAILFVGIVLQNPVHSVLSDTERHRLGAQTVGEWRSSKEMREPVGI